MTRIDAHHHVWRPLLPGAPAGSDPSRRVHGWLDPPGMAVIRRDFTLDDLAAVAVAAGVEGTILVQVLPDAEETAEFLTLAARDRHGLVAGVVGWVDLTDRTADALAALRAGPGGEFLVGVRHLVQGEADPGWLNRPDVRRGLRVVADAGLAYDLLTLPHQLPAAIATVRALPQATFVLNHVSKPPIASGELEPWASRIRELAAEPNVFCKLSGMVTEADHAGWQVAELRPYAEVVLDAFGPSRVMFGSDWPVCLLAGSYAEVAGVAQALTVGLTAAERAEVFGGTAARAYRLGKERR